MIYVLDAALILSATGQAVILLSVVNRVGVGGVSVVMGIYLRADYLCIIHSELDIITYQKPEVSIDPMRLPVNYGHFSSVLHVVSQWSYASHKLWTWCCYYKGILSMVTFFYFVILNVDVKQVSYCNSFKDLSVLWTKQKTPPFQ